MQFITLLAQCQLCYIALPTVKMCDKTNYHVASGIVQIQNLVCTLTQFSPV